MSLMIYQKHWSVRFIDFCPQKLKKKMKRRRVKPFCVGKQRIGDPSLSSWKRGLAVFAIEISSLSIL